jgi:hypothetical protein
MIRINTARLFAEKFDARLAGIVMWPDDPLFEQKCQGSLKSTKIDQIHTNTCFKIPGCVFSEVAEAPQAAPTRRTLVGDPGSHVGTVMALEAASSWFCSQSWLKVVLQCATHVHAKSHTNHGFVRKIVCKTRTYQWWCRSFAKL